MAMFKNMVFLFLCISTAIFPFFNGMNDIDARGQALGGAVSALPTDVNVIGVNPAGIPFIKNTIATFMANPKNVGTEDSILADAMLSGAMTFSPFGGAGFAVNYEGLVIGNKLTLSVFQATIGYGIRVLPELSIGVGGRLQNWALNQDEFGVGYNNFGVNVNAGIYYMISENFSAAISGNNLLGPMLNNSSGKDKTLEGRNFSDMSVRAGFGFRTTAEDILADIDLQYTANDLTDLTLGSFNVLIGSEFFVRKFLALRFGLEFDDLIHYQNILQNINISAGIGYIIGAFQIDVAYRNSPTGLTSVGTFAASLTYTIPFKVVLKNVGPDIKGPSTGPQEVIPSGDTAND
ncbi:MAG: hypothetical protein HZC28_15850 [Spirochaetes bacterium]|nr:hypothetical protein [Spirochaetota bacterium]